MKKIIGFLKAAWVWLNGKKQKIGNFYWGLWFPLAFTFHVSPFSRFGEITIGAGCVLTYLGIGHQGVKSYLARFGRDGNFTQGQDTLQQIGQQQAQARAPEDPPC